jgi:hypothetical protein
MFAVRAGARLLGALALLVPVAAVGTGVAPLEPTPLFNGENLDGLYSWLQDSKRDDPRQVFRVDSGMIHISGDGFGYLSTKRAYKDYRLVVEFKWGTRNWRGRERHARDSGIFLHSQGSDGNSHDGDAAYKAAIECQVMQGSVGDLLLIAGKFPDGTTVPTRLSAKTAPQRDADGWPYWQKSGLVTVLERGRLNWFGKAKEWEDRLDFRARNDIESPGFEWTRIECVCAGRRIQVLVNGTVVNEASEVTPSEGPILLQCEGSEIFFRRFELLPLK